jgi:NAD(P)-dependent dehydrogenase (short-subunit alcohol dehydrogenase family)
MSSPSSLDPGTQAPDVAIVTGAASGIGAATMTLLAERGWVVVGVDLDEAGLQSEVDGVVAAGGRAVAVAGDVSCDTDCAAVVAAATAVGRLAAVCNIAGIAPYHASVTEVSPQQWDRVLAVNLTSVYLMCRHAAPVLRDGGGGAIVNTASVHAFANQPGSAPYAASKGAIVALTRQMAVDLTAWGIRVNAVAPGSVDTPMSRAAAAQLGTSLAELGFVDDPRALGRIARPAEVAAAFGWLVGPESSFVNGTTIVVDGGLLAPLGGVR